MLPSSSAHCSSFSRQNFKKFSRSLERQCSCRTQSTSRKSDDKVPRISRPKYAKKPNFKPPYLPQMGVDSPQTKTIFLRVAKAIRCMSQMGVRTPEGGKPPKCTKSVPPPNFRLTLLEFHVINFREISTIVRRPTCLSNAVKKSKICRQSSEEK